MKNILVVGGAGYIGSYMCKYLSRQGYQPIVLDNLSRGHQQAVKWGPLIKGECRDTDLLRYIFSTYRIAAVMHFAAFCYVGESVENPSAYYFNNVAQTLKLLQEMLRANVLIFLFSSTCAVYGEPVGIPIAETHPQRPINPYGRSKLMVEQILEDFHAAYGLKFASLRYFNAAGADPDGQLGEDHRPETHLIPLTLQVALGQREKIQIFGDDCATKDGTCIRDYIHIQDLASAHLLALERLLGGRCREIFNLGTGRGYSVREVIKVAREISGRPIPEEVVQRRPGDPAVLVSSNEKAIAELKWTPRYSDLYSIIETAWQWHKTHPTGYR
ncbi:MAG: UDP-glucose 4-epimerase GalE [Deltaproteobacteria bacterium]|nr:UDP-glucose 4-epimerase GalE [Deltaproteobacteria bacterium]